MTGKCKKVWVMAENEYEPEDEYARAELRVHGVFTSKEAALVAWKDFHRRTPVARAREGIYEVCLNKFEMYGHPNIENAEQREEQERRVAKSPKLKSSPELDRAFKALLGEKR